MSKTILLVGITLMSSAASAYFWREARVAREQAEELQARVAQLEQAPQPSFSSPFVPPPAVASASPPTNSGPQSQPQESPSTAPATSARAMFVASNSYLASGGGALSLGGTDKLLQDPEYRAAMRMQQKMMMSTSYPDLADALQLQPEQVDQLMDLLAEQQLASMNRRPPFKPDGTIDQAAMNDFRKQMEQQQRNSEAQIANLLGSAKLQEWKDYQQSLGARMQVKQLRTVLENSSDPIRADQVQPLVSAMAAEQQRRNSEMMNRARLQTQPTLSARIVPGNGTGQSPGQMEQSIALMEQSIEQQSQYNQRMHDAVAPYLSSRQLERFDQVQNQQLEMQRINLRMMRARAEAEARGEAPPMGNSMAVGTMVLPD